jgi:hypothetical protein
LSTALPTKVASVSSGSGRPERAGGDNLEAVLQQGGDLARLALVVGGDHQTADVEQREGHAPA